MYGQNTDKKRVVLYGRLNDVRRKYGGQTGGKSGDQRAKSLRKADEEKSGDLHNNS